MAFGHVIPKEFHVDRQTPYFTDYCRKYSDMPFLVRLVQKDGRLRAGTVRARQRFRRRLGRDEQSGMEDGRLRRKLGRGRGAEGSIGFRWGEKGKWNLEEKAAEGRTPGSSFRLLEMRDEMLPVAFPYFGGPPARLFRRHRP